MTKQSNNGSTNGGVVIGGSSMLGLLRMPSVRIAAVVVFALSQIVTEQLFEQLLLGKVPFLKTFMYLSWEVIKVSLPLVLAYSLVSFLLEGTFLDWADKARQLMDLVIMGPRLYGTDVDVAALKAYLVVEVLTPSNLFWKGVVCGTVTVYDILLSANMALSSTTDPAMKFMIFMIFAILCLCGEFVLRLTGIVPTQLFNPLVNLFANGLQAPDAGKEE